MGRLQILKPQVRMMQNTVRTLKSGDARIRGRALQRVRDRVFTAACGLCAECKRQGRVTLASELDHVVPLAHGGSNDDGNLEPLCAPCHRAKTARDLGYRQRATIGPDGWPVT